METKFQTSFIPKKPVATAEATISESHSPSILFLLGLIIFILAILACGGAYAWKYYLIKRESQLIEDFNKNKAQFNLDMIRDLRVTEGKINLAKRALDNHISTLALLEIIGKFTADSIRFTDLSMNADDEEKPISFSLKGFGPTYQVVAFQSNLFSRLEEYDLRGKIVEANLSNPNRSQNGLISFDLSGTISRNSILYKNSFSQ